MMGSISTPLIKLKALELGFHKLGIARVDDFPNVERERLQTWLDQGYHASLSWMNNPKRREIRLVMSDVQSVIAVALNYYTEETPPFSPQSPKISRYAWGRDYHKVMHKKLKLLSQWLEAQGEGIRALYYADTGPIQDKVWAQQAGLGWVGKNSNLITRDYGSWVFLGEILTNALLTPDRPHTEHCGTCSRCIEACPTQAITQPFVVDANRCIAYHTIENRGEFLPGEIAHNLQNWVAGCDICQEVCPWNQRFAQPTDVEDFQPRFERISLTLSELAEISDDECDRRFTGSALKRIKPFMWRRNAQANLSQTPHEPSDYF